VSNRLLVDTSFVIALISTRDQYHSQAIQLSRTYERFPLVTTDAVLLEVGNTFARTRRNEASEAIERFLSSDEVQVVPLDRELFLKGLDLYKKRQDKEWSLVDCISFVVTEQEAITTALASDKHFAQAGYTALMVDT
jgi:predicted nucleic acid-binding protein